MPLPWIRGEFGAPNRTSVKLKALLGEGVGAAPQLPVLLQHQHAPAGLGQQSRSRQAAHAAAHHDGIEPLRHLLRGEHCGERGASLGGHPTALGTPETTVSRWHRGGDAGGGQCHPGGLMNAAAGGDATLGGSILPRGSTTPGG